MDGVTITLLFLIFAIVMFVWERIPLSVTAMIVAVGLVVTGVLSPKDAFAGFVDTNVLLFMAWRKPCTNVVESSQWDVSTT